ncbi:hypothetical protein JL2886_00451 [Phaeobacter gallaeciensis]|uniref:Uncharacterized protein n=1 Tax=Phaeobacter gallaeciensis TaxID=60890 RepID=A0A1B0ZMH8_9RHOB|nr:hypothetical protein JL2886_00451 [Phaeobacter gallaeciensis]
MERLRSKLPVRRRTAKPRPGRFADSSVSPPQNPAKGTACGSARDLPHVRTDSNTPSLRKSCTKAAYPPKQSAGIVDSQSPVKIGFCTDFALKIYKCKAHRKFIHKQIVTFRPLIHKFSTFPIMAVEEGNGLTPGPRGCPVTN